MTAKCNLILFSLHNFNNRFQIPQKGTTVLDFKKAIRRTFTLKQQRQRIKTKISWKYVWRAFHLQNIENGKVMRNNNKDVSEYGKNYVNIYRYTKFFIKFPFYYSCHSMCMCYFLIC